MKTILNLVVIGLVLCSVTVPSALMAYTQKPTTPQLQGPSKENHNRTTATLADEVRHQLVMLPYYGVFDWLEADCRPDGTVVLRGEVVRPSTKSDAEKRVKALESVTNVTNEIEVLPALPNDNLIRREIYRAMFKFESPLFEYALLAVPNIHIIVKGGHVTLKGLVNSAMDRQLAETAARQVPDVFDVKNELVIAATHA